MSTYYRTMFFAVGIAAWGCVSTGWGQEQSRGLKASTPPAYSPFTNIALPFSGYGEITLLDEGTLIIRAGVDGDHPPESGFGPAPLDIVFLQLDATSLSLVEHRGEFFLDENGKQIRKRDLSRRDAIVTPILAEQSARATSTPRAVAEFAGALYLSVDRKGSLLRVAITDASDDLEAFRATIRLRSEDQGETDGRSAESAGEMEYVSLMDLGGVASGHQVSVTCSAECTNGSCTMTCEGKCKAYCTKKGIPVCECQGTAE